ncbi:hypothetical protein [Mycobacterium sp.]
MHPRPVNCLRFRCGHS